MEQKEVVKFDDSFSEENLDIKEETILNPALKVERVDIDTIDISDIKTKPVKGEGGRNVKTTSYF